MTSFYNATADQITINNDGLSLSIQRRHSVLAPDECNSNTGSNLKEEDHGSSSSECASAGLCMRPMSTTDSSTGERSMSQLPDSIATPNMVYTYQTPMVNMQQAGTQIYQPVFYDQRHQVQQGYNCKNQMMAVPSLCYSPAQFQPVSLNRQSQQLDPQQVVNPQQQYRSRAKDWVHMPTYTSEVPCMMTPISYPQQRYLEAQPLASSVVSSTVSTPVFSTFSPPGYLNGYGYISTPVISSASCTPIPYSTRHVEVPPMLNLIKQNQRCAFPQKFSCNINLNPVESKCKGVQGNSGSVSEISSNTLINHQKSSTNPLSLQQVEKIQKATQEENVWQGNLNYEEYQHGGASNLFITWSGEKAELLEKLREFNFEVRDIRSTSDESVWNVIFETHPIARKAFTMQNRIRLRIVPPKSSNRIWLRNPSPKFLVKYETKCQLVVKSGKADCHGVVGELLKGCLIIADQLKGHRIRVVSCEGSFMFPGGKIVEMKGLQNESNEKASLGWISHRCKHTKESLVVRKSWNKIRDYMYNVE